MSRLIQLMGDGIEELWHFPDDTTDEKIKELYKGYNNSNFDSFEDYLESLEEWAATTERLFVDEIYV